MERKHESIAVKLLTRLSEAVYYWRAWFIYPQIVLFALCLWMTKEGLKFDTSRSNLVGSDKRYHQIYLKYKEDFNVRDDTVVVVESENVEKNRQFVERIGAKLEKETNLFSEVFYKGDLKMLGPKALLFLDDATLEELYRTLQEFKPFISNFGRATNLNSLFALVNQQFRTAGRQENANTDALIGALPALQRIVDLGADSIGRSGTPPSPGITALFGSGEKAQEEQYITFAKGRIYLVNLRTIRQDQAAEGVKR